MSYANVVPNRELRLNATVVYGGGRSCLASERRQGCLKRRARTFSQASVCQEWYSTSTLLTVENSAVIVHGPVGCVSSAATMNIFNRLRQVARGTQPVRSKRWFSTELGENEVIHGGEDKLRDTARAVDGRYHPEVIFVFTSCASGIIGDAVRDVVNALQSEVGAQIVLSECEGFKSSVWATGFNAAFHGITQAVLEHRNERLANLVNVISLLMTPANERIPQGVNTTFSVPHESCPQSALHGIGRVSTLDLCEYRSALRYDPRQLHERRSTDCLGIAAKKSPDMTPRLTT